MRQLEVCVPDRPFTIFIDKLFSSILFISIAIVCTIYACFFHNEAMQPTSGGSYTNTGACQQLGQPSGARIPGHRLQCFQLDVLLYLDGIELGVRDLYFSFRSYPFYL